jgi:hypothetical protein
MMSTAVAAWRQSFFLAAALSIIWQPVNALTSILDDTGSQAIDPVVSLKWERRAPSSEDGEAMLVGSTTVRFRLQVMNWQGRTAHIYLALPLQSLGPVHMSWTTRGALQSGAVQSGSRTLVYAGAVQDSIIEEVLLLTFLIPARLMPDHALPLNFHFELDDDR